MKKLAGALILIASSIWFLSSRLTFVPVPWPDGSAFYLPAIDLVAWPPRWLMHAQAAFVPSYDTANFNLMPALPLVLGVFRRLGLSRAIEPALAIRIVSMIALVIWTWVLWIWLWNALEKRTSRGWALFLASAVALAAYLDPVLRWGTMVVRTETWIGLCWLFILRELWLRRMDRSSTYWKISAWLALSAYFHFEAAFLVPAVALGLWPEGRKPWVREYLARLFKIGSRTLLFLSPWIVYVLVHWGLFWSQMEVQFTRLDEKSNFWLSNLYLAFHGVFLSHGSPVGWPKIFNVAKGFFWLLLIGMTVVLPALWRHSKRSFVVQGAAALAFWANFYLWSTKPEHWFITLLHITFWPWVGVVLLDAVQARSKIQVRTIAVAATVFAALSLITCFYQQTRIRPDYSWKVYHQWIDCIDRTIQEHLPEAAKRASIRIWQPHYPDALVSLAERPRPYDLTRTLDFKRRTSFAWEFTRKVDVLVMSGLIYEDGNPDYEGPARPRDTWKLENDVDIAFGSWPIRQIPEDQPGVFERFVCENGPFWADLSIRMREKR